MIPDTIGRWHALVERRDADALDDLLAEDVVFRSPIVHAPQVGRVLTGKYLRAALQVLNNDRFHYVDQWFGECSAVLEFATVIDEIEIDGVDIIKWNAQGKIIDFRVMVRPLKAINLLHQRMGTMLASRSAIA